ncbi:type VII secretion target [Nocardia mexicana]|uniref:Excreted virulence factor EspC (Type VII ESX diderm) n=1 Tax=Nocardia mexicana TaxID=279262 RepID=A0A370GHK7_9NOCA|nr:type VII secretion target [Nocardia mexicana]RDI43252.1 excreted virulence factor EspC (type VII ESX diderm) [Nocardia mexicana]
MLNVDPDQVRDHSGKVSAQVDSLNKALEAATYLSHVDDGYGMLIQPYATSILTRLHDRIVDGLQKVGEQAGTMPTKLNQAADAFEQKETASADALSGIGAQQGQGA